MFLQIFQLFVLMSLISFICASFPFKNHPKKNAIDRAYQYLDYGYTVYPYRRPNSRLPPLNKYHNLPFPSKHIQAKPYPYNYPVTVLVNNHRPISRPTTIINNHFPLHESTRRPLPTNEISTNNTLVFGLNPPQLHVTSNVHKDQINGVISSNAISFIDKPQDTTMLYSDLIVLKRPFGTQGTEPESLTVFVKQNATEITTQSPTISNISKFDLTTTTVFNGTFNETIGIFVNGTTPGNTEYFLNGSSVENTEISTSSSTGADISEEEDSAETAISQVTAVSSNYPPQIHTSISIAGTHNIVNRPPPPPQRQNLLSLLLQRPGIEGILVMLPGALLALTVIILLSIV
ncbi:uncharacterized protein [Centruroides vittatus]|uniref:uncharacterized protein n=1 Tax=Centruroides vittatus TaxID=120091 RepID=UPI00350EDF82